MGLERYLCVGGTEVANPNRTLAYMRRLGNPCQPTPPGDGCCTCPDWSPQACAITFDAGVQEQGPLETCVGIWSVSGVNPAATWLTIEQFVWPPEDCPPPFSPPPLPAPDDPGWVMAGAIPYTEVTFPLAGCGDPLPLPEGCVFFRYTVIDGSTGAVAPFYAWIDPVTGVSSVRFSGDGGTTWVGPERTAIVQPAPCAGGLGATTLVVQLEDGVGYVTLGFPGFVGPFTIEQRTYEDPTPDVTPFPAPGDPGWVSETLGPFPEWTPLPFGGDLSFLPTGWYMGAITDGLGRTFEGGWRWDGTTLAYSTDGGATWGPPPETGTIWLEEPPVVAGYSDPANDDAPWYDPGAPESADVLGVWLEEVRLGTAYQRDARPRLWGSSLGPARQPGRELTVIGWVYTRSEAATAYARNWLFEALQGGSCFGGNCDLPDAEVYTHCSDTPGAGSRLLKRVGLTGWSPDTEPTFPRSCGFKFEAVLTAEVPHLVTQPFETVERILTEGVETCTICSPCPELEPAPIACGCMAEELREVPAGDPAGCYCPPVQVHRTFVPTATPLLWSDAVAVITIDAGDPDTPGGPGLSNLRIRGWVNPVGLPAPTDPGDPNPFECQEPCLDVEVSCVPERGRLIIDGATRKATLEVAGQRIGAYGYLSSSGGQRFAWPEVSCHGLMLCIDAAVGQTPLDARVKVELVTRERG